MYQSPLYLLQVEEHLDRRQVAAQAFVSTSVKHAKNMFTVNPRYADASGSALQDADRYANTYIAAAAATPPQVPETAWWRLQQMRIDQPAAWVGTGRHLGMAL